MTENKSLAVILHNLSDSIIDEVLSAKKNSKLEISKESYFKQKISNFDYDKGITGFESNQETVYRDEWHWKDKSEFNKKIEALKSFQEAIEKIVNTYDLEEEKANELVIKFVRKITSVCIEEKNKDKFIESINLFLSELEGNPIFWHPVVWIDGIWMETDSIEVKYNILIRKPKPKDWESRSKYERYANPELDNWPSAVLELEYREKYPRSVQNRIDSLIAALRLFKLGSIEQLRTQKNPHSIVGAMGGILSQINIISAHFKYGLTEGDAGNLTKFIDKLEPLIYSKLIDKAADEADYINIAYDRFCDALLKSVVPENRLTTGIMALEALYLKEEEMSELTEKLSLRVALALEPFGYETLEVYHLVKRAYDIRSRFVHGSKVEQKDVGVLPEKILDYCRVSIIMFLQLQNELDKDKIINLLNKSLLDCDEKKKFHKIMKEKTDF